MKWNSFFFLFDINNLFWFLFYWPTKNLVSNKFKKNFSLILKLVWIFVFSLVKIYFLYNKNRKTLKSDKTKTFHSDGTSCFQTVNTSFVLSVILKMANISKWFQWNENIFFVLFLFVKFYKFIEFYFVFFCLNFPFFWSLSLT